MTGGWRGEREAWREGGRKNHEGTQEEEEGLALQHRQLLQLTEADVCRQEESEASLRKRKPANVKHTDILASLCIKYVYVIITGYSTHMNDCYVSLEQIFPSFETYIILFVCVCVCVSLHTHMCVYVCVYVVQPTCGIQGTISRSSLLLPYGTWSFLQIFRPGGKC